MASRSKVVNEADALTIRAAQAGDLDAIKAVHDAAFNGPVEGRLVAALHSEVDGLVSLLALNDAQVCGHILFSPVRVESVEDVRLWGLAPMAVRPALQRHGIGGRLVQAGITECRHRGIDALVVLGHANYYPRFGFRPASDFRLRCTYAVPPEAFMAMELRPGALANVAGTVHYHPVFAASEADGEANAGS